MKILENTDQKLIIVDRPWHGIIICLIFAPPLLYGGITGAGDEGVWTQIGLCVVGVALLVFAWWYLAPLKIIFDRPAGHVTWTISRIIGSSWNRVELTNITGVHLERGAGDDRGLKRLVLMTNGGDVPMEAGLNSFDRTQFAQAIETWLHSAAAKN
ncbi:MAG: hypothetical protein AAF557_14785 [Pseudomonadota bacterium]